MLELSANIELLFGAGEVPADHAARIRRAAAAGIRLVEMWGWRGTDLGAIETALRETGVGLTLLTSEPMGRIVDPGTHAAFLDGVEASAAVAATLGSPFLVVLAGDALPGVGRDRQAEAVINALRRAAPLASRHGVTLLLENLNTRVDHVGHFLDRTPDALDIVDAVGHPAVRFLFDLYHAVVMGESPADVLAGRLDRVAHVQIADVPGRHEPGTGRIDWERELGWLVANGYRGRFGLECTPTRDTPESLAHIRAVVDRLSA